MMVTLMQFLVAGGASLLLAGAIYAATLWFGHSLGDIVLGMLVATGAATALFVWLLTAWVFA